MLECTCANGKERRFAINHEENCPIWLAREKRITDAVNSRNPPSSTQEVKDKRCTCPPGGPLSITHTSVDTGPWWKDENGDWRSESCPSHGQELEGDGSSEAFPQATKPNNRIGHK